MKNFEKKLAKIELRYTKKIAKLERKAAKKAARNDDIDIIDLYDKVDDVIDVAHDKLVDLADRWYDFVGRFL